MELCSKKEKVLMVEDTVSMTSTREPDKSQDKTISQVAPKNIGKLDIIIAFDTTGSMSQYIGAVRKEASGLIPQPVRQLTRKSRSIQ